MIKIDREKFYDLMEEAEIYDGEEYTFESDGKAYGENGKEVHFTEPESYDLYPCTFTISPDNECTFDIGNLKYVLNENHEDKNEFYKNIRNTFKQYKFQNTKFGFHFINNPELISAIKAKVSSLIRAKTNGDTAIKSIIYDELLKKGYDGYLSAFNLLPVYDNEIDMKEAHNTYYYTSNEIYTNWEKNMILKLLPERPFIRDETGRMLYYDGEETYEISKLLTLVEKIFGINSNEYNDLTQRIEECFQDEEKYMIESAVDYIKICLRKADRIERPFNEFEMYLGAIEWYEKKCMEQYNKLYSNKISISLKQAYRSLPDNTRKMLTNSILTDDFDDKLFINIIQIFEEKCSKKDKSKYTRKEIMSFLTNQAMKEPIIDIPDFTTILEDTISSSMDKTSIEDEEGKKSRIFAEGYEFDPNEMNMTPKKH